MKSKFDVARQQYRVMCEAVLGHYSNQGNNNKNNEGALSKSRGKAGNDKANKKMKK